MINLACNARPHGLMSLQSITVTDEDAIGSVWMPDPREKPTQSTLGVRVPQRTRVKPYAVEPVRVDAALLGGHETIKTWRWSGSWRLHLPTLRTIQAWKEPTAWVVACTEEGTPGLPVALLAETLPSRLSINPFMSMFDCGPACVLFVPSGDAAFTDCGLLAYVNANLPRPAGFDRASTFEEFMGESFPHLTLAAPATLQANAVGEAVVTVTLAGAPVPAGTLFIETTAGYLPKQRATISKGVARFKFSALGLEAGDEIKLKVGWRYIASVAEAIVQVTE